MEVLFTMLVLILLKEFIKGLSPSLAALTRTFTNRIMCRPLRNIISVSILDLWFQKQMIINEYVRQNCRCFFHIIVSTVSWSSLLSQRNWTFVIAIIKVRGGVWRRGTKRWEESEIKVRFGLKCIHTVYSEALLRLQENPRLSFFAPIFIVPQI